MINQIRCLGVLATVKARQNAYPIRYSFKEFYEKFWECVGGPTYRSVKDENEDSPEWKTRSLKVIENFRTEFEEWKSDDESVRAEKTEQLITDGDTVIFLMQNGEKKLKEY